MNKLIVNTLKKWKLIPSYKLEPRVDFFFGMLLKFGLHCEINTEVIPEFPLKKRIKKPNEKETKQPDHVDFLVVKKSDKTLILVELKTDMKSMDDEQSLNYCKQTKRDLVKQFCYGWEKSTGFKREKYYALLRSMVFSGMISDPAGFVKPEKWMDYGRRGEQMKLTRWIKELWKITPEELVEVVLICPQKRDLKNVRYLEIGDFIKQCDKKNSEMNLDEKEILELLKELFK
jgi:hypothetical protein